MKYKAHSNKSIKVAVIQQILPTYRKSVFDLLSEKVELRVFHAHESSTIKQESRPYSVGLDLIRYGSGSNRVYLKSIKKLKEFKPDVVIHQGSPGILSLPLAWLWCRLNNSKFILWTHGFERRKGINEKSLNFQLRLLYMKISDAVLFYTKGRRESFVNFLPQQKLFFANNTIDSKSIKQIKDELDEKGKDILKKDKFHATYYAFFIGRLLEEKLPLDALKVIKILQKDYHLDIGMHFIGDGPELFKLKEYVKKAGLININFHGALYSEKEIAEIVCCSDFMVMPGYLGLSVNHSLLYRKPVVSYKQSFKGPYHSPEAEFLIDGKTGIWANPYDCNDMAKRINDSINNEDLHTHCLEEIEKIIPDISIEKMVDGIMEAIDFSLKK